MHARPGAQLTMLQVGVILKHNVSTDVLLHKGRLLMTRHEAREARRAARKQDKAEKAEKEKLPPQWEQVQGAIWLIGLAILFWQGWIFPGILVLIAISGLTQAAILYYIKQQQEQVELTTVREVVLPETCPNCGGPITAKSVTWTGRTTATCPFCGSTLKARETMPDSKVVTS
jgi:hypothetical protein